MPRAEPGAVIFPPPFGAEVIRDATKEGRTYVWRITTPTGVTLRKVTFRSVGEEGARIEGQITDVDGEPLTELSSDYVTWAVLESHAHYPAKGTVVEEETIATPAGTFLTWRYTSRVETEEGTQITRAWFAPTLPGAPVRHEIEQDGELSSKMILVRHVPGEPGGDS